MDKILVAASNCHWLQYSISSFLTNQQSLGLQHLAFWAAVPHLWLDDRGPQFLDRLNEQVAHSGMQVVSLQPAPYNYTMVDPIRSPRGEASLCYYRHAAWIAAQWQVPLLLEVDEGCLDIPFEQRWKNCCAVLKSLAADALKEGTVVALGLGGLLNSLELLQQMRQEIGCETRVFVDIHKILQAGETLGQWMASAQGDIVHIALADGRLAGRFPLGKGCYPIAKLLEELKSGFTGVMSLRMDPACLATTPGVVDMDNIAFLEAMEENRK